MGRGVALRINYLQLGFSLFVFFLSRDYSGCSVVSGGRDAWPVTRPFIHAALVRDSQAAFWCTPKIFKQEKLGCWIPFTQVVMRFQGNYRLVLL